MKVRRDSLDKPVIIMLAFSREVTGCCTCLLQKKCYHVFMLLVATTTLNTVSVHHMKGFESCAEEKTERLEPDGYMGSKFCHMWITYS